MIILGSVFLIQVQFMQATENSQTWAWSFVSIEWTYHYLDIKSNKFNLYWQII